MNDLTQPGAADEMVEQGVVPPPLRPRRKGIYILPNLFTVASLFGGFYAIVMAMNDRFDMAAIGVFCAMVLDSLDGRVARMTHTQTAFGEQMDSLSDMVSFGAAPALIVYEWALRGLGKAGWIAAFVYCACAALRLARFNTNIGIVDKRFFQGLPSPAAAALVTGFIWVLDDYGFKDAARVDWLAWSAFGVTLYAGLTMVTNAPFYSFKDISFKRSVPFIVIVAIALAIAVVNIDPPLVLFAAFCVYGVSGYAMYAYKRYKGRPVSVIATSTDEPDEEGLHR
jgi:CDP-diacylglycerol--serine O-phosphatidyltransferase